MHPPLRTEVCVLGGGPAGTTAARRLAQLGHEVLLVERAPVPQSRPGESLSAGILPLLDALGLRSLLTEAGFFRPRRSLVRWAEAETRERQEPGEPGFLVDRGRFDALLLDAARQAGARVLRPARAGTPEHLEAGRWRVPVESGGERSEIEATLLVDATGRSSRRLPGPRRPVSSPMLALCGYWRGVPTSTPEACIEAGEDEWLWGAPLPDGTFSAMVFLDPRRNAGKRREGIAWLYRSLLARSVLLRHVLEGELLGPVSPCNASASATGNPAGEDWLKVGEAAFSLDPLSSQGVQAAMTSALRGAVVAHTLLTAPANAGAAIEFHRARQEEAVERNRTWAARHYAERDAWRSGEFWRRRHPAETVAETPPPLPNPPPPGRPIPRRGQRVRLSEEARFIPTPAIRGNLVVPTSALLHPTLPRPVVFLDGIELVSLLEPITDVPTIAQVLHGWSNSLPPETGARIFHWLWDRSILVPMR